jgi:hypothetical protein
MSKGSGNRVKDRQQYADNYDAIFKKKKTPIKEKAVKIDEKVRCGIWGRGTRYHFGDETLERTGTTTTTNRKSSAENTLETMKRG